MGASVESIGKSSNEGAKLLWLPWTGVSIVEPFFLETFFLVTFVAAATEEASSDNKSVGVS